MLSNKNISVKDYGKINKYEDIEIEKSSPLKLLYNCRYNY